MSAPAPIGIADPTQPSLPLTPSSASTSAPALFDLTGRTALLTGGTRGIGQACAVALAQAGARVCLAVRPGTQVQEVLAALPPPPASQGQGGHVCVEADLTNLADVRALVPKAVEKLGGTIDIFVNCAGIQRRAKSEEFAEEMWDEVITVNLKAAWLLSQAVGAHMLARRQALLSSSPSSSSTSPTSPATHQHPPGWRGGKIINFGSLLTFQGGLTVPAYAAAKGGVGQFTKTLSNEWARFGINVNGIAPGYIATDMNEGLLSDPTRLRQISERIPANRWGTPADFAGPVLFLASDASRYVSGEMLVVDGGWMGR